ncbi:MAG: type II secretion system F family protein [Candidatus Omnitrophica bacterium]|nr:type II secretion system F family protein [Candidatus Omnitrophota bacterium]
MLLVAIFGLVFTATALLSWQLYPAGAKVVGDFQAKRIKRDARKLDGMFLEVPKKKLFVLYTISPLVVGMGAYILVPSPVFAASGAVFGIIVPTLIIKIMEGNRVRLFGRQLLDGLMILSSSLKGGLSLLQCLEVLVEEMPAPLSQEFSLVLRENQMGVPLHESLERLNKRMKSEELNLIITAIDIARETGGNLTEPFEKLMYSLRERDKLIGKVRTLTLQAKLQGILMSLMPIFFGIVVYYMQPEFIGIMIENPWGRVALTYAICSEIIGAFFLYKLSRPEV